MVLQKFIYLTAGAVLVLGLAACDQDEQGRILRYEKGTYLGPTDTQLSQETRDALRARATLQGGS
ncbi:hypothetical protein HBA54_12995 [Pelagibius litoralis]|uniref:Lipoprotein n=1 Tax=Pelagibius litoralis TaxID=374515 RepID=A0A967KFC9_9PROT|nr:hypothetical protein [Pelagibius litoralis]NIA69511.1 hypothetical protein [Pelagibius litoralis]